MINLQNGSKTQIQNSMNPISRKIKSDWLNFGPLFRKVFHSLSLSANSFYHPFLLIYSFRYFFEMQQKQKVIKSYPTAKGTVNIDIKNILDKILAVKSGSVKDFCLSEVEVLCLCYEVKKIIVPQPMLLQLSPPLNVCGDFHGQFRDLKQVFDSIGHPQPGTHYLFLGDYVDRGKQSLECICMLMAYKIIYPQLIFLLRGNHECSELNMVYGFYDECKRRVSVRVWKAFIQCFNNFPIAAVVGERIFCVHGGLSPKLKDLSSINKIKRPFQFQKNTVVCDILWSDPSPASGWKENKERGVSYTFGPEIVDEFIENNDLDLICRSHQIVDEGYEFFNGRKLLTIFSAPNYCSFFQNKGAVLMISQDLTCKIRQFSCQVKSAQQDMKREKTPYPKILRESSMNSEKQDFIKTLKKYTEKRRTLEVKSENHKSLIKNLINFSTMNGGTSD